jgi:hypothetical protein
MALSTSGPQFLETAERWIAEQEETLVLLRYAYCAGGRDFLLINSIDTFRSLLANPTGRMHVVVYRGYQLPLRGVVDDDFIQRALAFIPENDEYLILGLDHQCIGKPTRKAAKRARVGSLPIANCYIRGNRSASCAGGSRATGDVAGQPAAVMP